MSANSVAAIASPPPHLPFAPPVRAQRSTETRVMSCADPGDSSPNLGWRAIEVLCGQFGRLPDKAAAERIGISVDTWKTWKARRAKPGTDHLSALFRRFGSAFMAYVLAPFEEAHLDAKAARIEAAIRKLEAERASLEADRPRLRAPTKRPAHAIGPLVESVGGSDERDAS